MSKKVILIRGPQGAGKTTLVQNAGLDGVNLSLDKLRNIFSGDYLTPDGRLTQNHDNAPAVSKLFLESIDRRISAGEVVCVDATMANGADVYNLWKRFDAAGYTGLLVDLYGYDDDLRMGRNAARKDREQVPEYSVDRMKVMAEKSPVPPIMLNNPQMTTLRVTNDDLAKDAIGVMTRFLKDPRVERDLSDYREVVHIGDLQGCISPIFSPNSPLRDGLRDDTFYVFLGDLFDRGKENGEVGAWFVEHALNKTNVAFIAGNHEDYVDMQAAAGEDSIGRPHSEWERFSWPDLQAAGLTHRDMKNISEFSQDYLAYSWHDKQVLCSHAGFSRWPSRLELVPQQQMRKGNGRYAVDVDAMWSEQEAGTGRYQIHGHRNLIMYPPMSTPLSFNLEGQVEFGGHMRFMRLDENGFAPVEVRATNFRTMQEDVAFNRAIDRMSASHFPPILPWASTDVVAGTISDETARSFHDHEMIAVKQLDNLPGCVSVNFTRNAFSKGHWDTYTTLARGLFVDMEDNSIVARSFPKFFNRNERPETTDEGLVARVKFPLTAYEKLNGFLCITGYSERLGLPVIASKSRADGTFADMAQDVLRQSVGDAGMERILRLNRDQTASLVFEIEDPERDPHIIKLDRPNAVLIACIRRSEEFEQASHDDLEKIAKWVGCDVKKVVARLPNERALASFNHRVENDPKWVFEGRKVEGCVIEDQAGAFYKLKSSFYRNWKFMRSAVNEIRNARVKGTEPRLGRFASVPEEFLEFQKWACTLSATALETDIVALREAFHGDRGRIEMIVDDGPVHVKSGPSAEDRYAALIDQISRNEKITPEGLAGFLKVGLDDPKKADILRGHEAFAGLMEKSGFTENMCRPELF